MKEQWLSDIHDRMSIFEIEEPAGLWEAIEASGVVSLPRKKAVLWLWGKRLGVVAAMTALVLLTALFILHRPASPDPELTGQIRENAMSEIDRTYNPDKISDNAGEEDAISEKHNDVMPERISLSLEPEKRKTASETMVSVNISTHAETVVLDIEHADSSFADSITVRRDIPPLTAYEAAATSPSHSVIVHDESSQASRVMLGFSVGSGSGFNPNEIKDLYPTHGDGAPGEPESNDNPTETTHRLPVRTAVSFAYRINNRLSLESGLTYSYLSSDLSYPSKSKFVSGTRKLHYLGVPLKARLRILSWRSLDFYTSAGALMEKCIVGSLERRFTLDGKTLQTDSRRERVGALQWSANFSLGFMVNLTPSVGIYIEPGIGYYFDNHSAIPNIYQERPLNVTLDMGLRFSFGK